MNKYYFTFGSNHTDRYGKSLGRCFATIEADDEESARQEMVRLRDDKWCTSYESKEAAGVDRFELIPILLADIDTRELRKEDVIESVVTSARNALELARIHLEERMAKLESMKEIMRKLPVELIPKCREYNGQLDMDYLTREESKLALSLLGAGKWKKEINNGTTDTIDYTGKVNGIDVRLWAAGAPESCRVVEEEEVIPEKRIIRRRLVCNPA